VHIVDEHGLTVAMIEPGELETRPWLCQPEVDVVRLAAPTPDTIANASSLGFAHKPEMLTWRARVDETEAAFLARLATKTRQDVRRAQRRALARGVRIETQDPITAETLDDFLGLYEARVAEMRYGVAYGSRHREEFLTGRYYGVFAFAPEGLVGGCLVLESPEVSGVRMRFSAVTEEWRRDSLARTLYFAAMDEARARGFAWATLGDEPNLYGHLTQPGLFEFKVAMGFECVPSQRFGDPTGVDEADLVVHLGSLADPSLILEYAGQDTLRPRVLHGGTPLRPGRFAASFLAEPAHHQVPASREERTGAAN